MIAADRSRVQLCCVYDEPNEMFGITVERTWTRMFADNSAARMRAILHDPSKVDAAQSSFSLTVRGSVKMIGASAAPKYKKEKYHV